MSVFVGDEDVKIELEFQEYSDIDGVSTSISALDISVASEITFIFKKPDEVNVEKTKGDGKIMYTNTGTDGKAYYLVETGFLDQPGTWRYHGKIVLAGKPHYSSIEIFKVLETL